VGGSKRVEARRARAASRSYANGSASEDVLACFSELAVRVVRRSNSNGSSLVRLMCDGFDASVRAVALLNGRGVGRSSSSSSGTTEFLSEL